MEHTKKFDMVKGYYDVGMWTLDMVWNVTNRRTGITEDEYKEITGFVYPNKK